MQMQKPYDDKFRSSNVPKSFNKPKGKIEKINFTEEQKQEIKTILEGHKRGDRRRDTFLSSREYKIARIRRITGGFCLKCPNYNTHLIKYNMGGITLVERYCQDHLPT